MKKMLALLLAAVMVLSMAACAAAPATTPADTPAPAEDTQTTETTETTETNETTEAPAEETPAAEPENLTATQQIIKEAEGMTLEELAKKAIEESNGKMFYGVGNSSRGKSALPLFIEYLQSIDSSYNMEFEWQQPKNNKIFDQLTADSLKDTGTFAMMHKNSITVFILPAKLIIQNAVAMPPAFLTPSSRRIGRTPTAPPLMSTPASCRCRRSTRSLCTTAWATRPTITAGTSSPRASMACSWTSTPRSSARTSCTC